MARVIYVHNIYTPGLRREVAARRRQRVRAMAPGWNYPHLAILNGKPLLRAGWRRRLKTTDCLVFIDVRGIPLNGGGGGSNAMSAVLSIAMMVVAPYAASALLGTEFTASALYAAGISSQTFMTVATAAISMAGNALISGMLGSPRHPTPNGGAQASYTAASPTYDLSSQGNLARIGGAIPIQYGRVKSFPDLAAQPYVEYAGNEQYLYQLLCLGVGEYDVESILIEDTPISSFEEITTEIVGPYETLDLFPAAVATSAEVSGQELSGKVSGTYSQSGTTITVTKTGHGYATGKQLRLDFTTGTGASAVYTITVPGADTFTVTSAASATTSGNVEITHPLGPYVANGAGTSATRLAFDVVLPRGLFYANAAGGLDEKSITVKFEAQEVDSSGSPVGSWITLGTETLTGATATPQRRSYAYGVSPAGRYRCRATRLDVKDTSAQAGHELVWAGLRAYLVSDQTFGNTTLIALRMRATNNLSAQASRKIGVVSTRRLQTWTPGGGWSATTTATRSIAWAALDCCRSVGVPDSRLDLSAFHALDATWSARGDTFNGRYDQQMGFWDSLSQILMAGRARPYMQGGIIHVWRDQPQTLPVVGFTMHNIAPGSFSMDFLPPTDDTADAVEITYFDETTWRRTPVLCALPGSSASKPVKKELFGVTSRAQAYREGLYLAACNRYRRSPFKLTAEMEGFIPAYGDLCAISHDLMNWGMSAEAVGWDAATRTLTLSEPPAWTAGATHYVGITTRHGSVSGPYAVTAHANEYKVVLATDLEAGVAIYVGSDAERTRVMFGAGEAWRLPGLVRAARPRSWNKIELEFWNEDPAVHTADVGVTPPPINYSALPMTPTAPMVLGLMARSSADDINYMVLSWQPSPGADHYLIEQSAGDDSWTRVAETSATNYSVRALYASATVVRVAAVGLTRGPWATINYAGVADYMWVVGDDADPMWVAGDDSEIMWS